MRACSFSVQLVLLLLNTSSPAGQQFESHLLYLVDPYLCAGYRTLRWERKHLVKIRVAITTCRHGTEGAVSYSTFYEEKKDYRHVIYNFVVGIAFKSTEFIE